MELLDRRIEGADAPAESAAMPREAARRTLAMRIAHRNRLRAERLARLRPEPAAAPPGAGAPGGRTLGDEDEDAAAALEEFLRALTGAEDAPGAAHAGAGSDPGSVEPAPAAVLHFQRPEPGSEPRPRSAAATPGFSDAPPRRPAPAAAGDLARLPGMGPGLAWALARAGIPSLAALAALEEADLVARLGPVGRLIPARTWLAAARAAAAPA